MALRKIKSYFPKALTSLIHQHASTSRPNLELSYTARVDRLFISEHGGYQSRNVSTAHLLLEATSQIRSQLSKSFSIMIYTSDYVADPPQKPHFAYCSAKTQSTTISIPDFVFWAWPEAGINDYEETRKLIIEASHLPAEDSRLFWIGNPETHPSRKKVLQLASMDHRINAGSVSWIENQLETGSKRMQTKGNSFVSLPDHCRYQYLLDLQGNGYSGRVKLLLLAGRALFLQNRNWQEYFYEWLVPYEHYIPVREDLSDLSSQLDWAEENPDRVNYIAKNGQYFAIKHLDRSSAIKQLGKSILEISV